MEFDQEEWNSFVLERGVVGLFEQEKVLKSKRKSNWYVNWRLDDLWALEKVANFIVAFAKSKGLEPDTFYGVPEGATRLANFAQIAYAKESDNYGPGSHVLPMGRGKPKDHGDAARLVPGRSYLRFTVLPWASAQGRFFIRDIHQSESNAAALPPSIRSLSSSPIVDCSTVSLAASA